ncbi:MAG: histidine phosphatase family protein [Bacteroidales bacterium]|nr:histidine phosphatase family protein [Bacteroidales bacterium]
MKTLYIVRHAKSSWEFANLADHERPLIEKGKKRTKLVVDYLLNNKTSIDLILSSHAVRALETAKIIGRALKYPIDKIQISDKIYHGNADTLFNHFYELSDEIRSVMMVGHNPTFTHFANYFLKNSIEWLPTSAIVCIEFDTNDWANLTDVKKKVKFVITPKIMRERKNKN